MCYNRNLLCVKTINSVKLIANYAHNFQCPLIVLSFSFLEIYISKIHGEKNTFYKHYVRVRHYFDGDWILIPVGFT